MFHANNGIIKYSAVLFILLSISHFNLKQNIINKWHSNNFIITDSDIAMNLCLGNKSPPLTDTGYI